MAIERASLSYLSALLGMFVLTACPAPPSSSDDDAGTEDTGSNLQCDIPQLMVERCGGSICHGDGETPAADLDLVSANVEDRISGAEGVNCSGIIADPADPEGSLLYTKVAEPTCGAIMPLGGTPLSEDELTCMRQFISGLLPPGSGCTDCDCEPGVTESCYEGPEATIGVGICKEGSHTCQTSGLGWSTCEGQVLLRGEDCNTPEDENCDGETPPCSDTWAISFVGLNDQYMRGLAFADNGDLLSFGDFEDTVSFGGDPLTAVPSMPPKSDLAVVRHDRYGNPISARQFGDNSTQTGIMMLLDNAGNQVYLVRIYGGIDTGGGSIKSHGGMDLYVFKFDPQGNHVWSKMFGGPDADRSERMAIDSQGNVFVTGTFTDNAEFGDNMLVSAGLRDGFIMKLDAASGNVVWIDQINGVEDDYGFGIGIDSNDEVIAAGRFGASIGIGADQLVSNGDRDIYLAHYTNDGDPVWAKSFGGPGLDEVHDIAIQANDNIVMLGGISDSVDFGGGSISSAGLRDMTIVTFDPSGNHVWSKAWGDAVDQFETDGPNTWPDMTVDQNGNIYVGFSLYGSMDFGGGNVLTAIGDGGKPDIGYFVLTPDGDYVKGERFGGTGTEHCYGIAVSPEGYIALAGRSMGTKIDFGVSGIVYNWEPSDAYIAKLPGAF
ncbi:MAG: SBBP repeat-containing protein [Myxococcales bacterium]|nr:SBBP repeat-containing protein [Myxococcales bacterium]